MTVSFLLNGKSESLDLPPNKRLIDVIREDYGYFGNRAGCYAGSCGTCAVFINGELAYSCLVPIFAVQGADIITYEGMVGTREFDDIITGFEAVGYQPCSNCRQGKIMAVYALLAGNPEPERAHVKEYLSSHRCGCSSMTGLYRAIEQTVHRRRTRRHVR